MEIKTTRFGPVQIEPDDVIRFPAGVLGLESCRDWVLLGDARNDALAWLQSVDQAEVALAVVSPRRFVADYQLRVTRRELAPLLLGDVIDPCIVNDQGRSPVSRRNPLDSRIDHAKINKSAQVLVIASRAGHSISLNLKAPLVINIQRRLGRQVIGAGELPVRYKLGSTQPTLKKSA